MRILLLQSGIFEVKIENKPKCWCVKILNEESKEQFFLFRLSKDSLNVEYMEFVNFEDFPILKSELKCNLPNETILVIIKIFEEMNIFLRKCDSDQLVSLMIECGINMETVYLLIKGLKLLAIDKNYTVNGNLSRSTIENKINVAYDKLKQIGLII